MVVMDFCCYAVLTVYKSQLTKVHMPLHCRYAIVTPQMARNDNQPADKLAFTAKVMLLRVPPPAEDRDYTEQ